MGDSLIRFYSFMFFCSLFIEGLTILLSKWTLLILAIVNNWGGLNSKQKADTLRVCILDYFFFKTSIPFEVKDYEINELVFLLNNFFTFEFNVKAEDGSLYQVSSILVMLHNELRKKSISTLNLVRSLRKEGILSD